QDGVAESGADLGIGGDAARVVVRGSGDKTRSQPGPERLLLGLCAGLFAPPIANDCPRHVRPSLAQRARGSCGHTLIFLHGPSSAPSSRRRVPLPPPPVPVRAFSAPSPLRTRVRGARGTPCRPPGLRLGAAVACRPTVL